VLLMNSTERIGAMFKMQLWHTISGLIHNTMVRSLLGRYPYGLCRRGNYDLNLKFYPRTLA